MQRRFRQACNALRDHSFTGVASFPTVVSGLSELDLLVVGATSPGNASLEERDVWRLAAAFYSNPSSSYAFAVAFTRRFGRTRSWRVALKCLLLLHRLLRVLPANHPLHAEIISARENALISLYPCHFRDASSSSAAASYDFTSFIHSYARLLDEALYCTKSWSDFLITHETVDSFQEKVEEVSKILEFIPQVQSLMDRAMECEPAGAAAQSIVVRPAMEQIVRESFACYAAVQYGLPLVLDNLLQLGHAVCVAGLAIYRRAAEQTERLSRYYEACKNVGLCGAYEYPKVEKIPKIQVQALESLVDRMWQLTESSPSPPSSVSSSCITSSSSPTFHNEIEGNKAVEPVKKALTGEEWEQFAESEEEPLLRLGADDTSWEALLDASVDQSWPTLSVGHSWTWEHRDMDDELGIKRDATKVGSRNSPTLNPFFDHVDAMQLHSD